MCAHWERATRLRRRCPEFGTGKCQWLETSDSAVLAHCCPGDKCVFAIHNLSSREIDVAVEFGRKVDYLFDILTNRAVKAQDGGRQHFRLRPYGYRWLRESQGPNVLRI